MLLKDFLFNNSTNFVSKEAKIFQLAHNYLKSLPILNGNKLCP